MLISFLLIDLVYIFMKLHNKFVNLGEFLFLQQKKYPQAEGSATRPELMNKGRGGGHTVVVEPKMGGGVRGGISESNRKNEGSVNYIK